MGAVLFPHMPLPLHVFEERYKALARDCLRSDRRFGVVLIERGHEVGGGDSRFGFGTIARIVAEAELAGGRWALLARGEDRIRVATWLPEDPYPIALVERIPEPDPPSPEPVRIAERAVRRGLALAAELGLPDTPASTFELDETPETALWQLCALAPVGPVDRQQLLEASDHESRLQLLLRVSEEAADVFAYRLSGR